MPCTTGIPPVTRFSASALHWVLVAPVVESSPTMPGAELPFTWLKCPPATSVPLGSAASVRTRPFSTGRKSGSQAPELMSNAAK